MRPAITLNCSLFRNFFCEGISGFMTDEMKSIVRISFSYVVCNRYISSYRRTARSILS